MSSYRVSLQLGALRPSADPAAVLSTAAAAAGELANVEASEIGVVAGIARVTVRFTEDDDELARQIGAHTAESTDRVVEVLRWQVTERVKSRWLPVEP